MFRLIAYVVEPPDMSTMYVEFAVIFARTVLEPLMTHMTTNKKKSHWA